MFFKQICGGYDRNFTYIIGDENSRSCIVVDPLDDVEKILEECNKSGMKILAVINTHGHFDHTQGNAALKEITGAEIVKFGDIKDGDLINIGEIEIQVIHTPGHKNDSICLLAENKLLTGDTLFARGCGRTDLTGGDPMKLNESLKKIKQLDDNFVVYPGHDYGGASARLGDLKKTNSMLRECENKKSYNITDYFLIR